MLPPDSTATTGGSNASGCSSSAATPAAPAGSTTCLDRSRQSSSARDSVSSETVTTRTACREMISYAMSPGWLTAIPSAIVPAEETRTGWPAASEAG